jgi:RNA polymerase sigma-70 factor (ECF subfamily)
LPPGGGTLGYEHAEFVGAIVTTPRPLDDAARRPPESRDAAASFEPHRQFLVGLAYRMLGSVAEAEDVAQDAFLRWNATDRASVAEPRAFLARTASRLCLDRMKSARSRREQYFGTWLPEPVFDAPVGAAPAASEPSGAVALAEDVSYALLMTLERLSPLERAAFLLHDVFDMDYRDIADVLDRSEAACRQLVARGRDHVRDQRPRFDASPDVTARLASAFHAAIVDGNLPALAQLLAEDAVFYSDGGGKRNAAVNPLYGKDKIVRFVAGLAAKGWLRTPIRAEPVRINGSHGFVLHTDEGIDTLAFDVAGDRIAAIYVVRNPDKLRHVT